MWMSHKHLPAVPVILFQQYTGNRDSVIGDSLIQINYLLPCDYLD